MKILKFSEPLTKLILRGEKTTTWRVNDEKNITLGDALSLCRTDGTVFAKATTTQVKETTFGKLRPEDWKGHETFSSEKELYATYSKYYKIPINSETKVKIIKFKIDALP